jgi:hypothetical protein
MAYLLERIDYEAQLNDLLLSQFEDSPNIVNLIKSWLTPVQELEDSLIDYDRHAGITTAYGVVLDQIGSIMGVERDGRSDNEYRTAILGKAILARMDGTTERFLEGFRVLADTEQVRIHTYYPKDLYAVAGEGWNATLPGELKKIAPVCSNVHLIVGSDLAYVVPAIEGDLDNTLHTHLDAPYDLLSDGQLSPWQTSTASSAEALGTTTTFGWEGVSFPNQALTAFEAETFRIEEGILVDDQGNIVVDNNGNSITVQSAVVV